MGTSNTKWKHRYNIKVTNSCIMSLRICTPNNSRMQLNKELFIRKVILTICAEYCGVSKQDICKKHHSFFATNQIIEAKKLFAHMLSIYLDDDKSFKYSGYTKDTISGINSWYMQFYKHYKPLRRKIHHYIQYPELWRFRNGKGVQPVEDLYKPVNTISI